MDFNFKDSHIEKLQGFFDYIAIRDLTGEQKEEIANHIIDDVWTTLEYWTQMFLSAIIATLWLLVNATPVVIGAMIIAPIMRPIQWTAFAIATWNRKLFVSAFTLLILSILWWVWAAILITWIIPLTEVTNEIAARTQPTLVDLWIAIASWAVAFLSFWYKKMAAWLAWVAMAASLVPPLGVIWIWIAFWSLQIWRWSSVLFLTNLVAIIIAGIVIFYSFGFFPNQKDDVKRSFLNTWYVLLMLLLLCIPLASSLISITRDISTTKIIKSTTEKFLWEIDENIRIESLEYQTVNKTDKNISLSMKVPQHIIKDMTDDTKVALTEDLASKLEKNVALDVTIVPITSVTAKEAKEMSPEQKIRQYVNNYLSVIYKDKVTLLNTDYYTDSRRYAIATLYTEENIAQKQDFKNKLFSYINGEEDLIDIFSIKREENYTEPEKVKEQKDEDLEKLRLLFNSFFTQETKIEALDLVYTTAEIAPDIKEVKKTSKDKDDEDYSAQSLAEEDDETPITEMLIAINISTTSSKETFQKNISAWKKTVENEFWKKINLELVIQYLEKISF